MTWFDYVLVSFAVVAVAAVAVALATMLVCWLMLELAYLIRPQMKRHRRSQE